MALARDLVLSRSSRREMAVMVPVVDEGCGPGAPVIHDVKGTGSRVQGCSEGLADWFHVSSPASGLDPAAVQAGPRFVAHGLVTGAGANPGITATVYDVA